MEIANIRTNVETTKNYELKQKMEKDIHPNLGKYNWIGIEIGIHYYCFNDFYEKDQVNFARRIIDRGTWEKCESKEKNRLIEIYLKEFHLNKQNRTRLLFAKEVD